jgi:hypothetical protein
MAQLTWVDLTETYSGAHRRSRAPPGRLQADPPHAYRAGRHSVERHASGVACGDP